MARLSNRFMSTQTGGEGETIQSQPEITTTAQGLIQNVGPSTSSDSKTSFPENIQPIENQETIQQEPNKEIQTDLQPNKIDVEPPVGNEITPVEPKKSPVELVTRDEKPIEGLNVTSPILPIQTLTDDGIREDILIPSYQNSTPILTVPEFNFDGEATRFYNEIPDPESPSFKTSQEKIEYEKQQELSNFSSSVVDYFNEVDKKEVEKSEQIQRNNSILKGTQPKTSSYDKIADEVNIGGFVDVEETREFKDIKYAPSANMQTFMSLFNLDSDEITKISESAAGIQSNQRIKDLSSAMTGYSESLDYVSKLENILETGKSDEVLRLTYTQGGVGFNQSDVINKGSISSQQAAIIKEEIKKAKQQSEALKSTIDNFENENKINPKDFDDSDKGGGLNLYERFENQTNKKLKEMYGTRWKRVDFETYGGEKYTRYEVPMYKSYDISKSNGPGEDPQYIKAEDVQQIKSYAKWLDNEGRKLIASDIKNGTNTFIEAERDKLPAASSYAREIRNDLFEIEAHKHFQETGKVDNFTYSGFKATAKRIAKENQVKINSAIKETSEVVLANGKAQEEEWLSKNKKILMTQINDAKTKMDALFKDKLDASLSSNPEAMSVFNDYSSRISNSTDDKEKKKLSNEMMTQLKKYPAISKAFSEYESAMDDFTQKAQANFFAEYAKQKQQIYDNSVKDLQAGLVKSIKEVYRSGVNNDLNVYEMSNKIVNSNEFKQASYYEKRKMISDAWDREKAAITSMVKSGNIRFPKTDEERGKHWSQWTGSRAMTDSEKNKWNSELASRTGNDARNKFIFYAVDDLLYSSKGKPTAYAIQSFAKEQLSEISAKKKALGIKDYSDVIGGFGRFEYAISQEEAKQMLLTEQYLNKIINTPEADQGAWTELINGFSDGFQIPFLGSLLGIQQKNTLMGAVDRYQTSSMDTYDISLVDAYASMNKLSQLKPNSGYYNLGNGLGFTSTFMLEMIGLGGFNALGRGLGVKLTESVLNIGKSTTDDVVRASVEASAQSPAFIERTKSIVGFFTGGMLEGAINPRAYEASVERMIDAVTVQESGAYDGIISVIDRNSGEGTFEAFLKGYGNWMGMTTIERLGAHLPSTKLTQNVAQYLGTSTFMKRAFVGKLMRDYGFKSVDDAAEYVATNGIPWSGFVPEMVEEVLQSGWESIITGDKPLFGMDAPEAMGGEMHYVGMTADELKTTAGVVAIFGGVMNVGRYVAAKVNAKDNSVSIESTDENGISSISNMDKSTWDKYNSMMSDENLTWKSVVQMMQEDESLSSDQETAIANVLIQMRGKEILEDESYQEWKKENSAILEKRAIIEQEIKDTRQKAYDALTADQKKNLVEIGAITDYQFSTTGGAMTAEDAARSPQMNEKWNVFSLIYQNEETLSNPTMTIETEDENGERKTESVTATAEAIADKKRKRKDKKLTRGGARGAREVSKQREEEGIQFDMPKAEGAVTEEVPVTESTITTPIDLTDDTENITGVSGEERKGQEPIQTQPIAEAGQETPSVSGVVQEKQEVAIGETVEVNGKKYTKVETAVVGEPKGTAYRDEDGMSYKTEWVESNMTPKAAPTETKVIPKNKKERIDAALKGDMIYHNWFGSTIESTPEQYNSALKEIAETGAIEDVYKYGKNISTNQGPSLDLYSSSLLNTSQEDAQFELNQRAKTAPDVEEAPAKEKIEPAPLTEKTQSQIDALNERINEIYDNGQEDTESGAAEINILNQRIQELESGKVEARKTEKATTKEKPKVEVGTETKTEPIEEVSAEVETTEKAPVKITAKGRAVAQKMIDEKPLTIKDQEYIVVNEEEVKAAINELEGKATQQPSVEKKQEAKKEQKEKAVPKAKAETPRAKVDSDGFVSVESNARGINNKPEYDETGKLKPKGFYSVSVSEDGKKATVKDSTGKIVANNVNISQSDSGTRYVVAPGGVSVYIDRAVMSAMPSTKSEAVKEEKTGTYNKRVSSFYDPGKKTVNVGLPPSEINQLKREAETLKKDPNYANDKKSINRVKEIEDIINSNKGKVSPEAAKIEKELQYDPKSEDFNSNDLRRAGVTDPLGKPYGKQIDDSLSKKQITEEEHKALTDFYEQKKKDYYNNRAKSSEEKKRESIQDEASTIINNAINSEETTPEEAEALQDDSARIAVETALTDTKKKKPKNKPGMSASRRRGATVGLPETLLTRLQKAFPGFITGVDTDQQSFQAAARATGRSLNSAAIIFDGIVYLNDRVANANTAMEEFAHIYLLVMQANNRPLYNKGIKMVQTDGFEYIEEVMNDPGYDYIHNGQNWDDLSQKERDDVAFEAVSKMIADRGETILEQRRKNPIISFLKDFWKQIARLLNAFSGKLDVTRDSLDTYTNLIAKELLRGRPISTITPEKLADIMDPSVERVGYIPLANSSVMNFKAGWRASARRLFAANKGVGEDWGMKLKAPSRRVSALDNQVKLVVGELNKAIDDYVFANEYEGNKIDRTKLLVDIDTALKDPAFRDNFFMNDPIAKRLMQPVVMKMRGMVDALSKELVDSGRFGDNLVASINANQDMYLHTSYYVFSKSTETARENWLENFSDQDREEILRWVHGGGFSKAIKMNYKINPTTGAVTVSFVNSFGHATTEQVSFTDSDALKEYIKQNVKSVIGAVPASIDNYVFNSNEGEIELGGAMNIDLTGLKFSASDTELISSINDMVRNDKGKLTDFLNLQQQIVSSTEASITKKKQKRMNEAKKKFLMEIQDPAYNFANTVSKQASLLYKSELEKALIDTGYLAMDGANPSGAKGNTSANWRKVTNPNSELYNKWIPTEIYDMMFGTDLINDKALSQFGIGRFFYGASAMTKMALTILSPGSNAANYVSGWFQLAKTGTLPIAIHNSVHKAALRAVEQELDNPAEAAYTITNIVPAVIRQATKIFGESRAIANMNLPLNATQQARYGTNDFNSLKPNEKAQVLADELVEMGVINSGIESEALRNLSEYAFNNVDIPDNVLRQQITNLTSVRRVAKRARRATSRAGAKVMTSFADAYSFSDSVFKAMMYLDHKKFNLQTYGEEMRRNGMSPDQIDDAIKTKTAQQVRMQMPTYDRSPEFLRFLSRFPFIGPFVQFDFQNKINDKNILLDASRMMFVDAPRMMKNGMVSEAARVWSKGAFKTGMAISSQFLAYSIYSLVSSANGWDDDDDEAMRKTQPEYRSYNALLHMDSNKTGVHTFIDINRVMPQALYLKYWRAFREEGFAEAAKQFFDPYLQEDVFTGALIDTYMGINKYGVYDKYLAELGRIDKLKYMLTERLLPSTAYGQIEKVVRAIEGEESMEGVPADTLNEVTNILLGVKVRSVRLDKTFGQKVTYGDVKEIETQKLRLNEIIKERDRRVEQMERGVEAATPEDIQRINDEVSEEYNKFTTFVNDKMQNLYDLADAYRKLGFEDKQLYDAMVEKGTPQYFARAVLNKTEVKFNEVTGDRIELKAPKGRRVRESRSSRSYYQRRSRR